jgi:outer membrane lipoprotein-sorting protein
MDTIAVHKVSRRTIELFLILQLFLCISAKAQSFKDVIAKVKSTYSQSEQYHMSMQIKVYESAAAKSPFHTQKIEIQKDKENYLYQLTDSDMLMNEKYFLMVNKATRDITLRARSQKDEQLIKTASFPDMDSLLKVSGTPELISKENQVLHYRLDQKQGDIEFIDIFVSAKDFILKNLQYHYRSKQFVKIEFTRIDIHPAFSENTFSESHYITAAGKGKFKGTGPYQSYSIQQ